MKNIMHFLLLKAHPISLTSVVCIMNNFAKLQLLPMMLFSSEKELFSWTYLSNRAGDTGGAGGPCPPLPLFCVAKRKKGDKGKRQKRKGFKWKTFKRLSPRSKYYCFSHSRASRIQKFFLSTNHSGQQYFSVFHCPPFLKSIKPALLKNTPRIRKLLISPVWNKILKIWDTLFELINVEVQCSKN